MKWAQLQVMSMSVGSQFRPIDDNCIRSRGKLEVAASGSSETNAKCERGLLLLHWRKPLLFVIFLCLAESRPSSLMIRRRRRRRHRLGCLRSKEEKKQALYFGPLVR